MQAVIKSGSEKNERNRELLSKVQRSVGDADDEEAKE